MHSKDTNIHSILGKPVSGKQTAIWRQIHNVLQCIQIPQNQVTNVLVPKIESLFVISKYHNESND